MDFGQRLKYLRSLNKVTQEELAKHLKVGRPTIAGYETKGKQPSFELVCNIANYFNVSIDYLLGRTDIKEPINNIVSEESKGYIANENFINTEELSPESIKELEAYINLLKIRDMQERNKKGTDELAALD